MIDCELGTPLGNGRLFLCGEWNDCLNGIVIYFLDATFHVPLHISVERMSRLIQVSL